MLILAVAVLVAPRLLERWLPPRALAESTGDLRETGDRV
jgi:hypothetical protein